jgi:hypothetical protein
MPSGVQSRTGEDGAGRNAARALPERVAPARYSGTALAIA